MARRLLATSSRRTILRHPGQFALAILGVALGVAVVVSVDLAAQSAQRAFASSTEVVTGRTTHQLLGGRRGIAEEIYGVLRMELGIRESAPVVTGSVRVAGDDGRSLTVMGVDPFAESDVRSYLSPRPAQSEHAGRPGARVDLGPLLARTATAIVTTDLAADLAVAPGASVPLLVAGRPTSVEIVGLLEPRDGLAREALSSLLLMDIAAAQELLRMRGRLSRIDLVLPVGTEGDRMLAAIRSRLPGDVSVVVAAAREAATLEMTGAFRLNLAAMSLLALVCGTFLVYNTMTFSVLRRFPLIARLRALGVTRAEVFRLVLSEALFVGAIGASLGLIGGVALGRGLVGLVARTVNDLYFTVTVTELALPPLALAKGLLLGIGATTLATLPAAREATAAVPGAVLARSRLEQRARAAIGRLAVAGAVAMVLALLVLWIPGQRLELAFVALFVLVVGCALLTPAATVGVMKLAWRPARSVFGVMGGLAARGVTANLSRTSVAVAALMIAVSVIIGVGVMVASFRQTLVDWLDHTLAADLYVWAGQPMDDLDIDEAMLLRLRELEGVRSIQTVRRTDLLGVDEPTALMVIDQGAAGLSSYRLVAGDPEAATSAFARGAVLVSEPYAFHRNLHVGDRVALPTDDGPRQFEVAGAYASYESDRGVVLMARATYLRHWRDRGYSGVSVTVATGADADSVAAAVRRVFRGRREIQLRSNRRLREQSLIVFDRTFLITGVLRALVTLVACVGVVGSLTAIWLERTREIGILRATGVTPAQLFGLGTLQSAFIGACAAAMSLPVGLLLAYLMIHVINRRSFGWTMQMHVPATTVAQAMLVAVAAAVLAGLIPTRRLASIQPAEALREE